MIRPAVCETYSTYTRTTSLLLIFNLVCCVAAALNARRQNEKMVWSSSKSSTQKIQQQEVGRATLSHFTKTMFMPTTSLHLDGNEYGLNVSYSDDTLSTTDTSSEKSFTSCSVNSDTVIETIVPMDTPARQSLPRHFCLRPIPGKGIGVISLKSIAMGEVVGEYKGEVISQEVKDRRYLPSLTDQQTEEDRKWVQSRRERGQTISGCYLYGISVPTKRADKATSSTMTRATTIYVDAEDEYESLWTRFLNHAPLPYGNVHPKSIHESYDGKPRVWFVANRNIDVGEEICFDYGDDYWLEGDDVV